MTKTPLPILTALLMVMSASAMAQTVLSDKEMIELYCANNAGERGQFINTNGKTTLDCKSESERYMFEKLNAKLGIDNKDALTKKPYEIDPESWQKLLVEMLFEQSNKLKGVTCKKIDREKNQPVLRCKPQDILLTDEILVGSGNTLKNYYAKGAQSFANDPNKTELAPFLIAKDTNLSAPIKPVEPTSFKNYFLMADKTPKFPGLEKIILNQYETGYYNPRFWMSPPEMVEFRTRPVSSTSYRDLGNHKSPVYNIRAAVALSGMVTPAAEVIRAQQEHTEPEHTADVVVTTPGPEVKPEVKTEPAPAPAPEPAPTPQAAPVAVVKIEPEPETKPTPAVEVVEPTDSKDKDCKDELKIALSKLLEDDKQNIIGQQYELTVLKMAALVKSENRISLEGMIRKQSDKVAKLDKGIIQKMNETYKQYGLKEDAKNISKHLKEKAAKATYFMKDKRFFNEDSSAFLLAYQKMNEGSGIKDSDISVLWFMSKVSQKAQSGAGGKYSALANKTNLSTRIAQYTGLMGGNKSLSKAEISALLDEKQKALDSELTSFMKTFQEQNAACYKELVTDSGAACDLSVVEGTLSHLLAVQSQIPSTDLISLDEDLKGGFDKTRFKIDNFLTKN